MKPCYILQGVSNILCYLNQHLHISLCKFSSTTAKEKELLNCIIGTRNKRKIYDSYLVELIRDQCHFMSKWNAAVAIHFEFCYRVTEQIPLLLVSVTSTKAIYQFLMLWHISYKKQQIPDAPEDLL